MEISPISNLVRAVNTATHDDHQPPPRRHPPKKVKLPESSVYYTPDGKLDQEERHHLDVVA